MWNWFKSLDRSNKLLAIFGALIAFMLVVDSLDSHAPIPASARSSASAEESEVIVNDFASPTTPEPQSQIASRSAKSERLLPPTATVDGVTYSGQQQIEAMTQAARDAGMDEATARRTGEEAAVLCNGNPNCLR